MPDNIEIMHSYPEFPADVIKSFGNLMDRYRLKATAQGICSVNIDGRHCRLNFNMDRYDLQGLLYRKKGFLLKRAEDKPYGIINAAIALCPEQDILSTFPKTSYGDNASIRNLLDWHAGLVESCLQDVFKPGFDWKLIGPTSTGSV